MTTTLGHSTCTIRIRRTRSISPGEEFPLGGADDGGYSLPDPVPLPLFADVENLMMAGRNISVTHVALGTVRVQRTTGMMGEVLGMAAVALQTAQRDPAGRLPPPFRRAARADAPRRRLGERCRETDR